MILSHTVGDLARTRELAYVDELTGLPNRRSFNKVLETELQTSKRTGKRVAVMYFDLDRFKVINDCHGHQAGDMVIQTFGQRIQKILRSEDMIARLSGDEFAAVVTNVKSVSDIECLSSRILEEMKTPITYGRKNLYVGASIGISIIDPGSINATEALRQADFALLYAKEKGRNQMVFFDPEMAENIKSKSQMEADLREALVEENLYLNYQPLIDQDIGEIKGVEALVRWDHPVHGPVPPATFVPLAEEICVINQLGEFVLRRACIDIKPLGNIKLAVNVSPMQFMQDGFVDMVKNILDETDFEPSRLELEITEGILISPTENTMTVLQELRALGVSLALDDFGTGFSSMSYLREYPLDRIKIDKTFIDNINDDQQSFNFVTKMIDLGSSLGMNVTVEGIETKEQMQLIKLSACNELQGFYFSKPLSSSELYSCDLMKSITTQKHAKALMAS
ncbi:MAG: EAL domain-containing protein [Rhizobiaceae bacterium]